MDHMNNDVQTIVLDMVQGWVKEVNQNFGIATSKSNSKNLIHV